MVTDPPRLGVPVPTPGVDNAWDGEEGVLPHAASRAGTPTPRPTAAPRARNARRSYRSAESVIAPPRLAPGRAPRAWAPLAPHGRRRAAGPPGTTRMPGSVGGPSLASRYGPGPEARGGGPGALFGRVVPAGRARGAPRATRCLRR